MFSSSLSDMFSYTPEDVSPEFREKMAGILEARTEFLRVAAEATELRSRAWAGSQGAGDLADLKAVDLAKARAAYAEQVGGFLKEAIDVEGLMETLPMLLLAVLQKFNVPPMLLLEAVGLDIEQVKLVAKAVREFVEDV